KPGAVQLIISLGFPWRFHRRFPSTLRLMRKPDDFGYRLDKLNAGFTVNLFQLLANSATIPKVRQYPPSSGMRPIDGRRWGIVGEPAEF
ncbi:hypothetical protein, partial [Pseudomonas savastanoi]|uniref:hypothetical protein n=1 Tax=Pseudomonas savastanoi TaxID=29438 RepID=UPI000B1F753D